MGGVTLKSFIGGGSTGIIGVINTIIIPLIFTLAFAFFIWGVVKYFFLSGNEAARTEGRDFALWGVLGMALLFAVWGVVNILLSTLGVG